MSDSHARLIAAVAQLEPDAVAILASVAERLVLGRKQYGDMNLQTDKRAFGREALEEAYDGLVYVASALLRADMSVDAGRTLKGKGEPSNPPHNANTEPVYHSSEGEPVNVRVVPRFPGGRPKSY